MKIYEIQNKGKGVITDINPGDLLPLNPPLYFSSSSSVSVNGEGTSVIPYTFEVVENQKNPQKQINGSYTLTDADNGYTIFVNNGTTPVNITANNFIFTPNFEVGFVQQGTGDVTFVGTGISLTNPVGLKSKGQGYTTYIERLLSTNTFYLFGDTKN